ncbi:MAG: hypothetical protein ACNA7Q_15325 [Rhodobacterales bacterium]
MSTCAARELIGAGTSLQLGTISSAVAQAMRLDVEGIYTSVYGGDAVTLYQHANPFGLFDKIDILLDSANEFLVATAMKDQTPAHWSGFH